MRRRERHGEHDHDDRQRNSFVVASDLIRDHRIEPRSIDRACCFFFFDDDLFLKQAQRGGVTASRTPRSRRPNARRPRRRCSAL